METAIAVLRSPTELFTGIKGGAGFRRCLTFAVAMGVVGGIIGAVAILLWALIHGAVAEAIAGAVLALIQGAVSGILVPFIGGIIVWIVSMIFGSKVSLPRFRGRSGYAASASERQWCSVSFGLL